MGLLPSPNSLPGAIEDLLVVCQSNLIAGETASLEDPALDKVFAFAGEVGLLVLLHSDIDVPFAKEDSTPA